MFNRISLIVFALPLLLSVSTASAESTVVQKEIVPRVKMCPPGGYEFRRAWILACPMKRRKRTVEVANLNAIFTTIQRSNGTAANGTEEAKENQSQLTISSTSRPFEKKTRRSSPRIRMVTTTSVPTSNVDTSEKIFVAPSASQMMKICCEIGCHVTDLMPLCYIQWLA